MSIKNRVEQYKAEMQETRDFLSTQNKTAAQAYLEIIEPIKAARKWVEEESTLQLLKRLSIIASEDGSFSEERNKAEAMNIVKKALFDATTQFTDLAKKGFKQKNDGSLFKKDKAIFDELRESLSEKHGLHLIYSLRNNYFRIEARKHYTCSLPDRTGYQSGSSYEETHYFMDIEEDVFVPYVLETVSDNELKECKSRIDEIDRIILDLKSERSRLKAKLGV